METTYSIWFGKQKKSPFMAGNLYYLTEERARFFIDYYFEEAESLSDGSIEIHKEGDDYKNDIMICFSEYFEKWLISRWSKILFEVEGFTNAINTAFNALNEE